MVYTPPFAERYGGSAVATRWPHRVVEVLDLRLAGASDLPWCTMAVLIPVPGEGDLLFIAATASWLLDAESARERQALALTDLDARHRTALPSIIAGDFNAGPDAASIRYLTGRQSLGGRSVRYHDAWAVAGDGPGHTWTVDNDNGRAAIAQIVGQPEHRRRMDYVLVGSWDAHPRAHCRVPAARLAFDRPVDGIWPSDHFGVLVDVEVGVDA
jgi:endonuclease/exonuclease/phosphatase family metal-dependent hydrolase